jgi:hypothetical protein
MGPADDRQPGRNAVIPATWNEFYAATGIPAAVRSGNVLRLTGHTGDMADGTFQMTLSLRPDRRSRMWR